MRYIKAVILLLVVAALGGCTADYSTQKGRELAKQARLIDSVDIQRTNPRLLSRQAEVCLVSDVADTSLLRTVQAGFSGYFFAVGVENEPMDYLRAVAKSPCPGAAYLFYVQLAAPQSCADESKSCVSPALQYIITVVSMSDRSLLDRIHFVVKNSFIPGGGDSAPRLQKAFSQLAVALTGAEP